MKHRNRIMTAVIGIFLCAIFLSSCSVAQKKTSLRVIIVPKFEIGEMTGDFPGEAQLFYERYCSGCIETEIPHMPSTGHFYVNEEGVGILVTGSGKTAAGLSLMALLSDESYDCSDAYIVSVGCGGGNSEDTALGDIVVVTTTCDYDLGHHADSSEMADPENLVTWFPEEGLTEQAYRMFNPELYEAVYEMIKDCPLQTTELTKQILSDSYAEPEKTEREPIVMKGTALSGDNYWKGRYDHENAKYITEYYEVPDPYAVTEMEEIAIAHAAECFDMLDRVISLRVIVNIDLFLGKETPESLWTDNDTYSERVSEENNETLDIFEPAMHNLFDVSGIVIDALLEGKLSIGH